MIKCPKCITGKIVAISYTDCCPTCGYYLPVKLIAKALKAEKPREYEEHPKKIGIHYGVQGIDK